MQNPKIQNNTKNDSIYLFSLLQLNMISIDIIEMSEIPVEYKLLWSVAIRHSTQLTSFISMESMSN